MIQQLKKHLMNMPGWRTDRKIVVIESDDWGSIRIPDKNSIEALKKKDIAVEKCQYMLKDSLESNDDLEELFNVLNSNEKTPVITANFLTANPDFEAIKKDRFCEYHHESLETTLSRYPNHNKVIQLWKTGYENNFFKPQLHGREHLNISQWMTDLKAGNEETRFAFELGIFGVSGHTVREKRASYQAAFDSGTSRFPSDHALIIEEAGAEFHRLFGYKSQSFIAPNYVWGEEIEKVTSRLGIKYLQGTNTQRLPKDSKGERAVKRNFLGRSNKFDQKYLIRNCFFEPFSDPKKDWVESCFREVANSFFWGKPAVINTHRVNFVGSIDPLNREKNLKLFSQLVDKINDRWPEVEYLASDELGNLM